MTDASTPDDARRDQGTIVAFPFGPEEIAGLRAGLGAGTRLHACQSAEELMSAVARHAPDLVLVAVRDRASASNAPLMRRVSREFPGTPVVAYCALAYDDLHGALAAGRAGVRRLVVHGHDSLRAVLQQVRCDTERHQLADAVLGALDDGVSELLRWMVRYCVTHAREHPSVASVAAARRVSVGTLTNHLHRDGCAPPGRIIGWSRVLAAAAGMRTPGRSISRIAADLGFSNASELHMLIKRHTGLRATELRARGGLAHAAELFRAYLAAHAAPARRVAAAPAGEP
jgi:AraC-like DNA-binding protein